MTILYALLVLLTVSDSYYNYISVLPYCIVIQFTCANCFWHHNDIVAHKVMVIHTIKGLCVV